VASAYGGALERLSLGYEAHAERRRDLVQEIHVALFRALPSYEGRSSLRTWVYRVAHNVARDHVIRRSRDGFLRCVPIEDAADVLAKDDTVRGLENADALARLARMVRQLRPADRQVFLLYLEGFEHAEISEVCGISIESAATKVHRVKHALRLAFEKGGRDAA
jgi:RNA polymerase sigma-70 factor (ECF subfamily)